MRHGHLNYDCILLLVTTLAHASPTKFGPFDARADVLQALVVLEVR